MPELLTNEPFEMTHLQVVSRNIYLRSRFLLKSACPLLRLFVTQHVFAEVGAILDSLCMAQGRHQGGLEVRCVAETP